MIDFANIPIPIIVAFVGLAGIALGWGINGIAYFVKRKLTGASNAERASYLNNVTDLAGKLRANGMTLDDVHAFESVMRSASVSSSVSADKIVSELASTNEPSVFHSNVAMKGRVGVAYEVAEAKLKQALLDLHLLLHDGEHELLEEAQEAWKVYRRILEDRSLREYYGGTHAPLAAIATGLAETERRTDQILAEIDERLKR